MYMTRGADKVPRLTGRSGSFVWSGLLIICKIIHITVDLKHVPLYIHRLERYTKMQAIVTASEDRLQVARG